jgi:hypothetical protein
MSTRHQPDRASVAKLFATESLIARDLGLQA